MALTELGYIGWVLAAIFFGITGMIALVAYLEQRLAAWTETPQPVVTPPALKRDSDLKSDPDDRLGDEP